MVATHFAHRCKGKIHVAFVVQNRSYWPNHASIYAAMREDPAFSVSVFAIPKFVTGSRFLDLVEYSQLQADLDSKGIPHFKGFDASRQQWLNPWDFRLPEVVFLPQPYREHLGHIYNSQYWRQYAKIAYIPYGILMANLPRLQYQLPFFKDCWRIFVESEAHRALYLTHNPEIYDRTVVTGHPKTDAYLTPTKPTGLWKLPAARKRIIWAPHFTVSDTLSPGHTFSNFFSYFDFFVEQAKIHPDIEFMLRPHPELFGYIVAHGLITKQEAEEYRKRFDALPNGQVYQGADIFELFKESDALVLDSIGFLAEYLPTGNPICFLDSARRQRLNDIGEALLATYYKAWNVDEIGYFIENVVMNGNDPLKEQRLAALAANLYLPPNGAGYAIKEYIKANIWECIWAKQ